MDKLMPIGQVSRITGVSERSIRYYEKLGLIQSKRNAISNYRMYGEDEIKRLKQIVLLKDIGIPLAEIAELTASKDEDVILKLLENNLYKVENSIKELQAKKEMLLGLVNLARGKGYEYFSDFRIIKELRKVNNTFVNIFKSLEVKVQTRIIIDIYEKGTITEATLLLLDKVQAKQLEEAFRISVVTNIIKGLDRECEKNLMLELREEAAEVFEEVKDSLFTVDDIGRLDDVAIQKWLRNIEYEDLVCIIPAMSEETVEKVFKNLSKRVAEATEKRLVDKEKISKDMIYVASKKAIEVLRELERNGEIKI